MRRARYDEAISELKHSVSFARQASDRAIWAVALCDMGECEVRRGNPDEGRRYINEAIEMHRQSGRALNAVKSMLILGDILRHEDSLDEAEDIYRRIYEECTNASPLTALVARLNVGLTYIQRDEFEEAYVELIDCEGDYRRRNNRVMLAFTRCLLLPCLVEREDWQSFDERFAYVEEVTEEMCVHDIDLAICAELTGDLAIEREAAGAARAVLALAAQQWRGLGREQKARAVQQKLDELEL